MQRGLAAALLWLGAGFLLYALYRNRDFFHDDAYVTLRYARNLALGHGLVWNPGERVEGYSSFVATVLIALLGAAGLDWVVAARAVNLAALALLALLLGRFLAGEARRAGGSPVAAAAPVALTLAALPLAIWVLGGLESPLFALLCTASTLQVIALLRGQGGAARAAGAGVLLGISVLTRPDGGVLLGLAGLCLLAQAAARRGRGGRRLLLVVGSAALVLLPHALWRLAYYGAWLPNSVVAKTLGLPAELREGGWSYVWSFVRTPPYWPVLAAIGALLAWPSRSARWAVAYPVACVALYAGLVVCAGGDHMPALRVMVPLIPLCALVLGLGLCRVLAPEATGRALACAGLCAALALAQLGSFEPRGEDPAAWYGARIGRHIAERWPEGTLVALNTAGSTPFFAPRYRYLDMLGLNDPEIAHRRLEGVQTPWQRLPGHAKGDGRYVLERDPDVIVFGPAHGVPVGNGWFLTAFEIAHDPALAARLADRYELVREAVPGLEETAFIYYRRRGGRAP